MRSLRPRGGQPFRVSYTGGDGNDVAITVDSPPTITGPGNQTIDEDEVLGPLAVTIGDTLTPAGSLVLTATSSDQAVVADGDIVLGGSGVNRTITITSVANASGSTLITLTVTDNAGMASSATFTVNVTALPDPPTITIPDFRDYTIVEDHPLGPIDLTISDAESAPGDLTITVSSSNDALIPDANVVLSGTGPAYTLTATPLANATGNTIITITAFDGAATTDATFALTVLPQPSYTNCAAGMQPFDGTIRVFDTGARAHTEKGIDSNAQTWYFAEGAAGWFCQRGEAKAHAAWTSQGRESSSGVSQTQP